MSYWNVDFVCWIMFVGSSFLDIKFKCSFADIYIIPSFTTASDTFTCSRTDPHDASCCLFGSRAASCIYHDPDEHSPDGSYRWLSLSYRRVNAPNLASRPWKKKNILSFWCQWHEAKQLTLSWSCSRSLRSARVRLSSIGSFMCSSVSKSRDTSPPPDPLSPLVMSSSSPFSSSAKWWCLGVWVANNNAAAASSYELK